MVVFCTQTLHSSPLLSSVLPAFLPPPPQFITSLSFHSPAFLVSLLYFLLYFLPFSVKLPFFSHICSFHHQVEPRRHNMATSNTIGLEASHSPTLSQQPSMWWNPHPLCCSSLAPFFLSLDVFAPAFFFFPAPYLCLFLPLSLSLFICLSFSPSFYFPMSLWASPGLVAVGSTRASHTVT